jgi:hypothetical protein
MIPRILQYAIQAGRDKAGNSAQKLVDAVSKKKVYGDPKLGDIRSLRKQSNLHLQRKPDVSDKWIKNEFYEVGNSPIIGGGKNISSQLRNRIVSPAQKATKLVSENAGTGALGVSSMIGIGGVGIYKMIQDWIASGDLDEDFEEADLERLMMESEYDANELDERGEIYSGDNEDEMFLRSYVRGGQTGLRNEQGDFMTAQEAKDELKRKYGSR